MAFLSGNMKGVHIKIGPDLRNLHITELEQVTKHLLQIVLCGHVQPSLACVVLHRHQIRHRGRPIRRRLVVLGELIHQLSHRLEVAGSNGREERLVGQETQRLGVHY